MLRQNELDQLYARYGFEKKDSLTSDVSVYTYRSGYFLNATIVPRSDSADTDKAKKHFEASGYACTVHNHHSIQEAENLLFDGFFDVQTNKQRALSEYERYSSKISVALGSDYSYVSGPYESSTAISSGQTVVEACLTTLQNDQPTLLIIEAAAGYGKTCTAYELFRSIAKNGDVEIPILAELSRNRQAKIFRYVLLDEINRLFPSLRYELVSHEIANGRLLLIVDGFDELIRSNVDDADEFEDAEPMLETISALLKRKARVVVTSRRTALFSGEAFNDWVAAHSEEFEVVRLGLKKPDVVDWIGVEREHALTTRELPVHELANPVLLSFVKNLTDEDFQKICIEGTENLVDYYFRSLLDREQERQQLRMDADEQRSLFVDIATQMRDEGFTTESSEFLQLRLQENHSALLSKVRDRYSSTERPTLDELSRKLIAHALLDKRGNSDEQIGFVNDFAFGTMLTDGFIHDKGSTDWLGDQVFLDIAIMAAAPRSAEIKNALFENVSLALGCLDAQTRLQGEITLKNANVSDFVGETFTGVSFDAVIFSDLKTFVDCVFVECVFHNCRIELSQFPGSSFLSCRFYYCEIANQKGVSEERRPKGFSCTSDPDSSQIDALLPAESVEHSNDTNKDTHDFRKNVLLHFWPAGKPNIQRNRNVLRNLYRGEDESQRSHISSAIDDLRRSGIITLQADTAALNMQMISEIREILERS